MRIADLGPRHVVLVDDERYRLELTEPHYVRRAALIRSAQRNATMPPHLLAIALRRLWLDASGDGVEYQRYRRVVQADTAAPDPRVPVPIFKGGPCGCHPGGRHPAGSVLSPSPLTGPNVVVWTQGDKAGMEFNAPFRFVHYEAPPLDIAPGETKAWVYDAGVYAIEGWDGLPAQTYTENGTNFAGDPVFVRWNYYQPAEVWLFLTTAVIHFVRVERIAGSMLKVGDQMGTIYTHAPRASIREPWDLYQRLR